MMSDDMLLTIAAMQMYGKPFEQRLANLYSVSSECQRATLAEGFSACFGHWRAFVKDAIDVEATDTPETYPPTQNIT